MQDVTSIIDLHLPDHIMEDTKPTPAQLAQPRPVEKSRRRGAVSTQQRGRRDSAECRSATRDVIAKEDEQVISMLLLVARPGITSSSTLDTWPVIVDFECEC